MRKIRDFFRKRSIVYMIRLTNETTDLDEIKGFEDTIIASMMSLISFVSGILNFIVRMIWNEPIGQVLFASVFLIGVSVVIDLINYKVKKIQLRIHLISLMAVILEVFIVMTYYRYVGTIVWTGVFLFLMISIIRFDRIMFAFVSVSAVILNQYLYFTQMNTYILLDKTYYIIQISLFVLIFIIGMIWSKIYHLRVEKSHRQFAETLEKKEEITGLYEEIVATEEELREQNERLFAYNQEITENEKRLNYMAYNDMLTGLPNRKQLVEKLNFLIDLSEDNDNRMGLVFIDLDDFKKINDTRGHHYGDEFLRTFAHRLSEIIDPKDTACRFGGDEFAIIIQHFHNEETLLEYIDDIRLKMSQGIMIENEEFSSGASYGVAIYPEDADRVVDLLKAADVAMYKAKDTGKNNIQFYRQELKEEIMDKIELEHDLSKALKNNEFYLVYQPKISINDKRDHGFEALIRWESPSRGLVYPDQFIPIMESTGLIVEVGYWIIEEACRKVKELVTNYKESYHISVNISTKQLMEEDFVSKVEAILGKMDVAGDHLEFEITETVLIEDTEIIIEKLKYLKKLGIKVALDDFGTGYASLNYLKVLPLDVLKIDKSFIWDMDKDESSRKLVKSIIDIVHDLELVVIAEGVETKDQLNYLIEKSCDQIQGYLISKPMAGDDMHQFILSQ